MEMWLVYPNNKRVSLSENHWGRELTVNSGQKVQRRRPKWAAIRKHDLILTEVQQDTKSSENKMLAWYVPF